MEPHRAERGLTVLRARGPPSGRAVLVLCPAHRSGLLLPQSGLVLVPRMIDFVSLGDRGSPMPPLRAVGSSLSGVGFGWHARPP